MPIDGRMLLLWPIMGWTAQILDIAFHRQSWREICRPAGLWVAPIILVVPAIIGPVKFLMLIMAELILESGKPTR